MDDKYDWEEWDRSATTFGQHMIAGCIAGVSEHIVFFPIDTLRVLLMNCLMIRRIYKHSHPLFIQQKINSLRIVLREYYWCYLLITRITVFSMVNTLLSVILCARMVFVSCGEA